MRKTTVIWIVIIAAIIAGGVVTYLLFGTNTPIGTQVATPQGIIGDRDGDGLPDFQDYYPNNSAR